MGRIYDFTQGDFTMGQEKVRLNLQVSQELSNVLDEIAESSGGNRTDVIRQALALVKIAHEAKKEGRHLGLVSERSKLDTEIVGLL
jgi:metal-responsive CopG/Arc/MetJ family transcriptional regulator